MLMMITNQKNMYIVVLCSEVLKKCATLNAQILILDHQRGGFNWHVIGCHYGKSHKVLAFSKPWIMNILLECIRSFKTLPSMRNHFFRLLERKCDAHLQLNILNQEIKFVEKVTKVDE